MNSEIIAIKFSNVSKTYKLYKNSKQRLHALLLKRIKYIEKNAVDNVCFEIHQGEMVALLGRNGAGKSTILKLITGVCYPTKGKILVNGRVGALLELTSGLDPEFTGRENIYLKCRILGMKEEEIRELENDIIDFAELDVYIDQPVRTYSSGMKARLGFAINVNMKPGILIIDEALSVGDARFASKCRLKIKSLVKNEGITLLFVTHSSSASKIFCERGLVIENGIIVFDDIIDEAIDYYEKNIINV